MAMNAQQPWILKCTDVPQFEALQAAAEEFQSDEKLHLRDLCNDTSRCAELTAVHISDKGTRRIILDYSRQQVTGETMELLFDLADAVGFTERREAFRIGERINTTEDRPVLHHLLRMPKDYNFTLRRGVQSTLAGKMLEEVHAARNKVQEFSNQVRSGTYVGVTGKPFLHTLVIGTEGVNLGTEFVFEALVADKTCAAAAEGRTLHFLSNVDPVDCFLSTQSIDPERTLVVVIGKTFQTGETMLNARSVRDWLVKHLVTVKMSSDNPSVSENGGDTKGIAEQDVMAKHMFAVSCHAGQCQSFGIPKSNVFVIWDWIVGRYSVCSAIGLLPLSLHFSYGVMEDFLRGSHDIDEHFFYAPLRNNIPVLLGLLGVWNSTFMGYSTRAILPYAQTLKRFPAYVQHVDMESNGKRVALDGVPLLHPSGEIDFGEPGTNSHHSFFQLMHQGRVVPADFIGFMASSRPIDLPGEAVSSHDEFMSNFFAQPDALAYGKTLVDLIQEGVPESLREHMVFTGMYSFCSEPASIVFISQYCNCHSCVPV